MSNSLVSDAHVQAALEYLADDPHPVAVTKTMLLKAENARKRTYAELFGRALGKSNPEKDAWVLTHADYIAAQEAEAEAMLEHERHRARVKSADTITELWRSVQANQRASERVR